MTTLRFLYVAYICIVGMLGLTAAISSKMREREIGEFDTICFVLAGCGGVIMVRTAQDFRELLDLIESEK